MNARKLKRSLLKRGMLRNKKGETIDVWPSTSKFPCTVKSPVNLADPVTSNAVPGADVFIPILSLITSIYNRSVLNAKDALLNRLFSIISPVTFCMAMLLYLFVVDKMIRWL